MKCPSCGFENPPVMRFCGMCGQRIAQKCPACQSLLPLNFRFCGNCGLQLPEADTQRQEPGPTLEASSSPALSIPASPVEATVQVPPQVPESPQLVGKRVLATILIADVKGSTTLMEKLGTEDWVTIMNKVLQLMAGEIYRFGGEVDQFRGDGLIAFFGAWSAHEDDPERATFAGLLMQLSVKKFAAELKETKDIDLSIRVGINTGEVIAGNIGDMSQHSEDTAMGGAIALAARLENQAEPGTVLAAKRPTS